MATVCVHRNATITFYETIATDYVLTNGEWKNEDSNELEGQPLPRVDVDCPDCRFRDTFDGVDQLPEPLRTFVRRIREAEYGNSKEE